MISVISVFNVIQQMPLREMNGPQGVDDIINELRKDLGENDDISAEI